MKPSARASLACLILIALAGCASDDNPPPMYCPQVERLQQAETLTTFLPGQSDVASQITTAQITGIAGSCVLQPEKQLLQVRFQVGFAVSNGPANHSAPLNLPWFVAITDGDEIIQETDYTVALKFDGNASTSEATSKQVHIELPNRRRSGHIQVLVGFKGTPAELGYAAEHPGPGV